MKRISLTDKECDGDPCALFWASSDGTQEFRDMLIGTEYMRTISSLFLR